MPTTTAIYTLALAAGSDVKEANSTAATVVNESCDTLASQEGLQGLWVGTEHESPETLQLFMGK